MTVDVGGGGPTGDEYGPLWQDSNVYFVSNLGNSSIYRYGAALDDNGNVDVYEVRNTTWYTPPEGDHAFMDNASLNYREIRGGGLWNYDLGDTRFIHDLSGSYEDRHPGWLSVRSLMGGYTISSSNPYTEAEP